MEHSPSRPTTLALFCKVVDNFGDIGICWRLAQQFSSEHSIAVTLWVDNLASFKSICPQVDVDKEVQHINHITVQHWANQDGTFTANDVADIVIEFFACDIPPSYITAMSQRTPHPVWFNLEGLTAEQWVEGCHTLPSPHPSCSLTKYFFFPGFTDKTGGLLRESSLLQQREKFQNSPNEADAFLRNLGVTPTGTIVSLFCYPHAPVTELFAAWENHHNTITCLVPEGVASDAVSAFLGCTATAQASATRGALTVRVIPFLAQSDYDKLLWSCDVNFVRGEDSFVRAQWAGRPFIWHIYPQDKNLHHVKLNAFLNRYTAKTDSLAELSLKWNAASHGSNTFATIWQALEQDLPQITNQSADWQQQMLQNGDLVSNIIKFAQTIG